MLENLYALILSRKNEDDADEKSYTRYLFEQGLNKILKKMGEECTEVVIAAKDGEKLVDELADLTYHMLVLMAECGVPLEALDAELSRRAETMGNLKDANTKGDL